MQYTIQTANMRLLQILLMSLIFFSLLFGCAQPFNSAPLPTAITTPTSKLIATEIQTAIPPLTTTATPSTLPTETLTHTPQPTLTPPSTKTPASSPTPSNTPTPTITPTPLPDIVWGDDILKAVLLESGNVVWSPNANEVVLDYCSSLIPTDPYPSTNLIINIAFAPLFNPVSIQAPETYCSIYAQYIWQPDGQRIAFSAVPVEAPYMPTYGDGSFVFVVNQNGEGFRNTGYPLDWDNFYGWMGNNKIVTSNYSGGGHAIIRIDNIDSQENLAWGWSYGLAVPHITQNYAVLEQNLSTGLIDLGLFSTLQLRPIDEEKGRNQAPYAKFLAEDETTWEPQFGSKFMDSFHQSEQLLVLTWADSQILFDEGTDLLRDLGLFDIQIWDLSLDRLKIEIPNGLYGRISPDDRYLLYIEPSPESPLLKLKVLTTQEVVFSHPSYVEFNGYPPLAEAFTTFSPDGRYLTYFDIDQQLVVFDVVQQQVVATIAARFEAPIWSPDNTKMTFTDANDQIAVFDLTLLRQRPLTTGNDLSRLSNPQWSYDGSYLSVTIDYGGQNWGTAILTFAEN